MLRIRSRKGFSLIEVAIATAILAVLMAAALSAMRTGQETYNRGMAILDAQFFARRALDDISYELYSSSITTLSPPDPSSSPYIRFQKNTDFVAGAIVWSNPYQIEIDTTGTRDKLVIWEDLLPYDTTRTATDGRPVVLSPYVMTDGLKFTLRGTRLQIEVGVELLPHGEAPARAWCETTITLRN